MSRWALLAVSGTAWLGCGASDGDDSTAGSSAAGATTTGASAASTESTTGSTTAAGSGGSTGTGGTTGVGGSNPYPDEYWSLPEGNNGIAAQHPGDQGIASDSNVIFADDFEGYATQYDLWNRWTNIYQQNELTITTDASYVFAGKKSLQMTLPQQSTELANAVEMALAAERDTLFVRYYSRFEPSFDVVGSSHNGATISAHYLGPGIPADGTNHFLVAIEDGRFDSSIPPPGQLNAYVYWPLQRDVYGDHFFPTGEISPNTSLPGDFGPGFVSRPNMVPDLSTWYCYEFMVHANTPGQLNGRITFWIDGKIVADWGNLRLRDVDTLKIDRFALAFHAKSNPATTRKWFDNVVAATSYIGPLE